MARTPSGDFTRWIVPRLPANTRLVQRRPLHYSPAPTTEVNASRLPPVEELATMELAFREQQSPDDVLWSRTKRDVLTFIILGPIAVTLIPLVGQVIPIQWALGVATILGFLSAGLLAVFGQPPGVFPAAGLGALVGYFAAVLLQYGQYPAAPFPLAMVGLGLMVGYSYCLNFAQATRTPQSLLYTFIAPVGAVLCGWGFSSLGIFQNRISAFFILGGITLGAFGSLIGNANPITFYREWLLTHPRLRGSTRHRTLKTPSKTENRRGWIIFGLSMGAIYFLPLLVFLVLPDKHFVQPYLKAYVSTFGVIVIAAMCFTQLSLFGIVALLALLFLLPIYPALFEFIAILLFLAFLLGLLHFDRMIRFLAPYLHYNGQDSGAAGVWIPKTTLTYRRSTLISSLLLLYLTAAVGMKFYPPAQYKPEPLLPKAFSTGKTNHELPKPEIDTPETRANRTKYPVLTAFLADLNQRGSRSYDWMAAHLQGDDAIFTLFASLGFAVLFCNLATVLLLWAPTHLADGLRHEIEGHYRSEREIRWLWALHKLEARRDHFGHWAIYAIVTATASIYVFYLEHVRSKNTLAILAHTGHKNIRDLLNFPPKPSYKAPPRPAPTALGLDHDGRDLWTCYVDRLRGSSHTSTDPQTGSSIREAEHLYLGSSPEQALPVLLDEKLLSEHCYIMGDSGSGKTSLGIAPLLIQLIRGHASDTDSGWSAPAPIVILDLKGDPALFNTVKDEAERRGQEFLFFTPEGSPEKPRASHRFNPFRDFDTDSRSPLQLCHLFLDSLSLNHGDGYGRSYFSRRSRMLLFSALNHPSKPRTFTDLYAVLSDLARQQEFKENFELISTIHALTQYPQLVTSADEKIPLEYTIHMPTVIDKGQVVYFWLPAAVESISAKEIGKLALYSLLTAAIDRQRQGQTPRQVYLVIDEFQRIAGENFKIILEQARSFGLSAILSNQTINDLRTHEADLRPTIRANTRVKMFFSVAEPTEIQLLSDLSGEEVAQFKTESYTDDVGIFRTSAKSKTVAYSEVRKPRLTFADIQHFSDQPTDFILHVSRGSGYTQFGGLPNPVRALWPMSYSTYKERSQRPWPQLEAFASAQVVASSVEPKQIDKAEKVQAAQHRNEVIRRIWEQTPN